MQKKELEEIFERYKNGECSDEERAVVENWYLNWKPAAMALSEAELTADLKTIKNRLPKPGRGKVFYYGFAAAAVVLFTVGFAFYFYSNQSTLKFKEQLTVGDKIIPGGNKALLTLANGKTIVLDSASVGKLTTQAGISITKTANGELIYTVESAQKNDVLTYNAITTPRGGQYQVLLPDGTRVWLNASSNLKFPVAFQGNERRVELSGEAYFEVMKNKAMPFKVKTASQEITVLGTHFNVNAYPEENIAKTTLLEGSVRVTKGDNTALLKPGQQALNDRASESLLIKNAADVSESIAWKNGLFVFEDEDIYTIMNKIARWYDVEIEYTANMKGRTYSGNISRFTSVREVLQTMELTETVHFKIEERRIIVMP